MFIEFKEIENPLGFPILYQFMPADIQSVSIDWVLFVGAADDESVGLPGLYHWFEHVPFRGTKRFPEGRSQITKPFTRKAGRVGAWTNPYATNYYAYVPLPVWKDALTVTADLFSAPILADEAIQAERLIIEQEIGEALGTHEGYVNYHLPSILWPGHPFGHDVLGATNTLRSMDGDVLRRAHQLGYDRSRLALVVAGNISENEIQEEVVSLHSVLPNRGLVTRRMVADRQPLPQWRPGTTTIETSFTSSIVDMLFPIPNDQSDNRYLEWDFLESLFEFGGASSPLYRIVREDRNLAYSVSARTRWGPGGGYFGFRTEVHRDNIEPVLRAFEDVIKSPDVCTNERRAEVLDAFRWSVHMKSISPAKFGDAAVQELICRGRPVNERRSIEFCESLSVDRLQHMVQSLRPDRARVIIHEGMG